MMEPFERFLGVEETADAMTLLDLSPEQLTTVQIEQALRNRLAAVYSHPDGRSDEAEMVRQALRRAAEELKQASSRTKSPASAGKASARTAAAPAETMFHLTPFDRLVLAVLVGYGGWNAQSRARLVAVSAAYGVSVSGLMRVVQGLGEYARSGGPKLAYADITPARPSIAWAAAADSPGAALGPALIDRAAESLAIELRRGGPWITIKLAIIFGIATVIASIVGLRIVLVGGNQQVKELAKQTPASTATAPEKTSRRSTPRNDAQKSRIATFAKEPGFLGNGMPPEAVTAVDELVTLPQQFDELTRKLIVADEPSEAVYRNWDLSIQTIATGWTLADESTRKEVEVAMFEALRAAADTPSVSDRLLRTMIPPATAAEPIAMWRGAWMAGMLGDMSSTDVLPPVIVERARAQAELALSVKQANELNFELAARAWLDRQLPHMVASIEFDGRTYDTWELWLAAHRVLGVNEAHDASLMNALEAVLLTQTDLSRPGPTANVLGRLLRQALARSNRYTKGRMLAFFDNEQISARDLWVLTSLLSISDASTWFPDELVIPDEADQPHRWRVREDLAKRWPIDDASEHVDEQKSATALSVNPQIGGMWVTLADELLREQVGKTPEDLVWQLVRGSRLLETALALEVQNEGEADYLINEIQLMEQPTQGASTRSRDGQIQRGPETIPNEDIEKEKPPDPGTPTGRSPGRGQPPPLPPPATRPSAPRLGQPLGRDGEWTLAYNQAGRNVEARLELIRQLVSIAGSDLGPIDAERFVQELYRGAPPEIRTVAQQVAVQQFSTGPNVAMELLNQFAGVPASDGLSQMIHDLAGVSLPNTRESTWAVQARLALVRHVLSLRSDLGSDIESMMEMLIDSHVRQFMLLQNEQVASIAPSTAQDSAAQLAKAWHDRASLAVINNPVPGDLSLLQRRQAMRMKLIEGPIQAYLAHQLNILDLLTYLTSGERPAAREDIIEIVRRSNERRARSPGALEQAVETQRAMLLLWKLRFDVQPVPTTQPAEGTKP